MLSLEVANPGVVIKTFSFIGLGLVELERHECRIHHRCKKKSLVTFDRCACFANRHLYFSVELQVDHWNM